MVCYSWQKLQVLLVDSYNFGHQVCMISQRLVKAINIILKSHSATFCLEATKFCFFFVNNTTSGLYVVPTISPVEGIRLTRANTS